MTRSDVICVIARACRGQSTNFRNRNIVVPWATAASPLPTRSAASALSILGQAYLDGKTPG
jgi:hypothetical protein